MDLNGNPNTSNKVIHCPCGSSTKKPFKRTSDPTKASYARHGGANKSRLVYDQSCLRPIFIILYYMIGYRSFARRYSSNLHARTSAVTRMQAQAFDIPHTSTNLTSDCHCRQSKKAALPSVLHYHSQAIIDFLFLTRSSIGWQPMLSQSALPHHNGHTTFKLPLTIRLRSSPGWQRERS